MLELILGGARSGKSGYALQCAIDKNKNEPVLFIATATANDDEMRQRINLHKQQRPKNIDVIEEPLKLADVLIANSQGNKSILIDCLTLWVSNLLLKYKDKIEGSKEFTDFIDALDNISNDVYIVSNEVGMGIIPLGHLNRIYCDAVGRLHQAIATKAQRVTLMVAGLPHSIKSEKK